jgi:hypothetical protein
MAALGVTAAGGGAGLPLPPSRTLLTKLEDEFEDELGNTPGTAALLVAADELVDAIDTAGALYGMTTAPSGST